MATAKPMPDVVAQAFDGLMPGTGQIFNIWIKNQIIDILNSVGISVDSLDTSVGTLNTEIDTKSASTHNHNLADLTERSYDSLTDTPAESTLSEADVVADGPTAVAVSALTLTAGADTVSIASTNTSIATLVTEINNLKDDINSLTTVHDDLIDKMQAAGLMGT